MLFFMIFDIAYPYLVGYEPQWFYRHAVSGILGTINEQIYKKTGWPPRQEIRLGPPSRYELQDPSIGVESFGDQ